jgi:allophanate hydrolase subunit 2
LPAPFRFSAGGYFVLTGAARDSWIETDGNRRPVNHGQVYVVRPGDILEFGEKIYGLRTYLCYKPGVLSGVSIDGRVRGPFRDCASWPDPHGRIRVLPGPEGRYLDRVESFFEQRFRVGTDSNAMGLRLDGDGPPLTAVMDREMISDAVSDGTVQLTPRGPVVLLRQRQTVGGYPRVFNVISADLDLLAQVVPGEILRFTPVSPVEALDILNRRKRDLDAIRSRFSPDRA